jgi:hypothetical protein
LVSAVAGVVAMKAQEPANSKAAIADRILDVAA